MSTAKLTPTSFIVLGLLEEAGQASPYDLKVAVARSVGNFWSVPHSQLYREAERLHSAGYLKGRREATAGGRPRRLYWLNDGGREALARWREDPAEGLPQLRDPGLLKLFFGADPKRLAPTRRDQHRRQLDRYLELKKLDVGSGPRGPWLALESGIGHEREWVRFWSRLANQ
jgi:PadR family transcriptional regulator, regulatory protein AphA